MSELVGQIVAVTITLVATIGLVHRWYGRTRAARHSSVELLQLALEEARRDVETARRRRSQAFALLRVYRDRFGPLEEPEHYRDGHDVVGELLDTEARDGDARIIDRRLLDASPLQPLSVEALRALMDDMSLQCAGNDPQIRRLEDEARRHMLTLPPPQMNQRTG